MTWVQSQRMLKDGFFCEPTVLSGVNDGMRVAEDQIPPRYLRAANIANDTRYWLGSGVWTKDLTTAHRTAEAIRAGNGG